VPASQVRRSFTAELLSFLFMTPQLVV
jgi:hypothetical protein